MDPATLIAIVQSGESNDVEFKSHIVDEATIARQLSGLANSGGGLLIVGVDDAGIRGLSDRDAAVTASRILNVGKTILPTPPSVEWVNVDGQNVVVSTISGVDNSVGPVMTAEGLIYRRLGTQTVPQSATFPGPSERPSRRIQMFVAMSFHFEEEPALVDYYEATKRAAESSVIPVDLRRIDLIEGDYEIMQRTEDEIRAADVVLIDFTLNSPNVYYEAGLARALDKRMIRTARKDTVLPFDVRQYRTHIYVNATQLEAKLVPAIVEACSSII